MTESSTTNQQQQNTASAANTASTSSPKTTTTTTPSQITQQIKSSGLFDQWRSSLQQKYRESQHYQSLRDILSQRFQERDDVKALLRRPDCSREEKFQQLYKLLYGDHNLHQELKGQLTLQLETHLQDQMHLKCTEVFETLEMEKLRQNSATKAEEMKQNFEEKHMKPLQEKLKDEQKIVDENASKGWIDDAKTSTAAAGEETSDGDTEKAQKTSIVTSDELAHVAQSIDKRLFEKPSAVDDPNLKEQLKNAGDRLTMPVLGELGLLIEKDRINVVLKDGRKTLGKLSRDLRVRWTNPQTEQWEKFDTLSHFVGHVHLNLPPVSNIPQQFDGWEQCEHERRVNQTVKKTPFAEMRKLAIQRLKKYTLEDRLNQERVSAHPSFEASQSRKRNRHAMESQQIDGKSVQKHLAMVDSMAGNRHKKQKVDDGNENKGEQETEEAK